MIFSFNEQKTKQSFCHKLQIDGCHDWTKMHMNQTTKLQLSDLPSLCLT